jgi:hypothetical protein
MTAPAGNQRVKIKILKAQIQLRHAGTAVWRGSFSALLFATLVSATGCHSYHVEATVENRTGAPIQQLEVDYPSASFGSDKLAAGADFRYRIQLRGSGPIKVQYTSADGHPVQINGPAVAERQEGQLQIVLLPEGKAGFHPQLTPAP